MRLVERLRPDVLVVDLMMPGLGGLEVGPPDGPAFAADATVVLSMHKRRGLCRGGPAAGAVAYVLKDSGADELIRAVREAAAGRRFISPAISPKPPAGVHAEVEGSRGRPV